MKKYLLLIIPIVLIASCKDAQTAQLSALGKPHIITQYGCDGKVINKWESTGGVSNEQNSDGWYFEDAKTHKLIEVTGTVLIEVE